MFAEQEAPEWLPPNVMRYSRYSEKTIRIFTEAVIDAIVTGSLKYSLIRSSIISYDQVDETKAILGSLRVILLNASKQHLTEMMLASDLQMLGLPYHYQSSICRPYSDHKIELQEVLASQILLLSHDISFDWNIHAMIDSEDDHFICNELSVCLSSPTGITEIKKGKQSVSVCIYLNDSNVMYYQLNQELRKASSLLSIYDSHHCCVCLTNKSLFFIICYIFINNHLLFFLFFFHYCTTLFN